MRITRGKKSQVKANDLTCMAPDNCGWDAKSEAIACIKSAVDYLTQCADEPVCKESIANLSVVLLDLTSTIELPGQEVLPGVEPLEPIVPVEILEEVESPEDTEEDEDIKIEIEVEDED